MGSDLGGGERNGMRGCGREGGERSGGARAGRPTSRVPVFPLRPHLPRRLRHVYPPRPSAQTARDASGPQVNLGKHKLGTTNTPVPGSGESWGQLARHEARATLGRETGKQMNENKFTVSQRTK
ncbi:hypothetical protein E2C01_000867 [Portunus trituberculatus]|uniref:Uncharacterized protein n=1 Tax=Portunus trituberculatus TaxID=210409 RepID=A0A5B7CIS5_PORTR|nr:hypothetical protein [Portunus trituberculatus]